MLQRAKIIIAGMIGNALEFYDFSLYGFFAPIIAKQFFPAHDPVASVIYTLGVFAVGFLMRPMGAIVFGYLGDKYGRKRALALSVILMAVPTTAIGLLPPYEVMGIWAPIALMICRLMQGLCTGGEYNGAAIFVLEHQNDRRGLAGGLITSSCAIGSLLGTGIGIVCSYQDTIWFIEGWRIPFLLGIAIGGVGMFIRRKLDESPVFQEALERQKDNPVAKAPLIMALKKHPASVFCIIGVSWLNGVMYYASFQYITVYLNTLFDWPLYKCLPLASVALFVYAIMTPVAGALSDRVGIMRLMRPAGIAIIIGAFPLFWLVSTAHYGSIIIAQVIFALLAAFFSGPINALMQKLFPVEDRYSGIAFSYSIGMAVFGGFTPVIMAMLLRDTQWSLSPAIWLAISATAATLALALVYPRIKVIQD